MRRKIGDDVAAEIAELGDRVDRWRSRRSKLSPMPAALWETAVALARDHGVYAVARGAGVAYSSLRRRLLDSGEPLARAELPAAAGPAAFLEIGPLGLLGPSAPPGPVVEVARADGARLLIRLPAAATLEVAALVAAFSGGEA